MKTKRNQMKSKAIIFALFIACSLMTVGNSFAQNVGISNTYITPDPSSMLDVVSTDRGILIPRMTEIQRNAIVSPAMGLQIFNLTTKCINLWIGTTWKQSCFDCDFNSPVAGNNGPMCQGSALNLTATSIIGATYQWSGPNGFTSTDQNPSIPNATSAASGSYSVTATKNGCTSTPQSTVATVNSTPVTPTAGNSGPGCVGALLNLTASTIVGATYSWTGPNGYSASVQNPIITSAQLTNAGTYNVIATVNGCLSAAGTTTVTMNATPATPGSISGPSAACANSTGNIYSIAAVSGAITYNWLVPSGASITANTGTSITVTFGGTPAGNITVSTTNICGTSGLSTLAISTTTVCSPMTISYSGSIQIVTVPSSVTTLTIEVWGAQGGNSGGKGARMKGDFTGLAGQQLKILVGQQGTTDNAPTYNGGGGGGGTFVTLANNSPLIIAGGGGGYTVYGSSSEMDAKIGTSGGSTSGGGGTGGNGGGTGSGLGSGGGGLNTNGGNGSNGSTGGNAFINGGTGGSCGCSSSYCPCNSIGGFGGGGGGWHDTVTRSGGGGGYSGGEAGTWSSHPSGGGGGSYNSGTNPSNSAGVQSGNGQVILTW